jgi:Protein of unknown function (DUF2924)
MRGSSLDREAVEAEIDRVRSLGFDELRALWCRTFRSSRPGAFTKDLVARFICWHLQEQALGGLDANCAKLLDGLARGDKGATDRTTDMLTVWAGFSNPDNELVPGLKVRVTAHVSE